MDRHRAVRVRSSVHHAARVMIKDRYLTLAFESEAM